MLKEMEEKFHELRCPVCENVELVYEPAEFRALDEHGNLVELCSAECLREHQRRVRVLLDIQKIQALREIRDAIKIEGSQ